MEMKIQRRRERLESELNYLENQAAPDDATTVRANRIREQLADLLNRGRPAIEGGDARRELADLNLQVGLESLAENAAPTANMASPKTKIRRRLRILS